eukprot:jgi/Astpho2/7978/Aster-x0337
MENSRFLGQVEVPLADTLVLQRGTKQWYPLMRRATFDRVSGRLQLAFAWDVSARGLLVLRLRALEHVLQQRKEILCMLKPISPRDAIHWSHDRDASGKRKNEAGPSHDAAHSLAEGIMIKHSLKEQRSSLQVTVLEAKGLTPRKGVVVAFQANDLPNPLVALHVEGHQPHNVWEKHTLKPRFNTSEQAVFPKVPADTHIQVQLFDNKGGVIHKRHQELLGEAQLCCSHLQGEDPVYIWVPLHAPGRGWLHWRHRHDDEAFQELPQLQHGRLCCLQVFLRLQWVSGHSTKLEARLSGSIQRLQLDNQMLDASQPVVLAPASAAHAHSKTAQSLVGGDTALVTFGCTRSYANALAAAAEPSNRDGMEVSGNAMPANDVGVTRNWTEGYKMGDVQSAITSFKDIHLQIGEMDFQAEDGTSHVMLQPADDGFLEALLSFVVSIPMADIWQGDAWREQQRRLLEAQFGPHEVESLAQNAVLPLQQEAVDGSEDPLMWVQAKELRELQIMRGQSSYTSWYFIEHAEIGDFNINVTIALTSSVLTNRAAAGSVALPENRGGLFSRLIGASGFQLINVNNVPLQLRSWSTDTQLLGRKALIGTLSRHYLNNGIREAHKVLGGAGPAITAVPLTVVWAGTSALSLLNSIRTRQVGPVGAFQRVGFVLFTGMGQILSSFSRIAAAVLTLIPPNRAGHLSDRGMLTLLVSS